MLLPLVAVAPCDTLDDAAVAGADVPLVISLPGDVEVGVLDPLAPVPPDDDVVVAEFAFEFADADAPGDLDDADDDTLGDDELLVEDDCDEPALLLGAHLKTDKDIDIMHS